MNELANDALALPVLVLGYGSIGRRHTMNLKALGCRAVSVFDPSAERLSLAKEEFEVTGFDSLEDALASQPAICFITTPSSLHLPLALECAQIGAHLFIEKPLGDCPLKADELLSVVRDKNLTTLVGCNMRFHPALKKVKALILDNTIGKVYSARIECGQYLPDWRPQQDYRESYSAQRKLGGGVILDIIHEIDYARWLLGEVTAVTCFADQISDLEMDTEDIASIVLRFQNRAIGHLHLDYLQRAYSRSCHIIGQNGTIRWEASAPEVRCFTADSGSWEVFKFPGDWDFNEMYIDELKHFISCVYEGKPTCGDVFDARRVLEVAFAAHDSSRENKVVQLSVGA